MVVDSFMKVSFRAAAQVSFMSDSAIRSCGRFGPARHGTTRPTSSDSVLV